MRPCTNCGALKWCPTSFAGRHFCNPCAAVADMLAIGARSPVFLYESPVGVATTMGGIALGVVVRKTMPKGRSFSAVRFRVRMLDGSLWHGTGPTQNGNYIRLRPMKGT